MKKTESSQPPWPLEPLKLSMDFLYSNWLTIRKAYPWFMAPLMFLLFVPLFLLMLPIVFAIKAAKSLVYNIEAGVVFYCINVALIYFPFLVSIQNDQLAGRLFGLAFFGLVAGISLLGVKFLKREEFDYFADIEKGRIKSKDLNMKRATFPVLLYLVLILGFISVVIIDFLLLADFLSTI